MKEYEDLYALALHDLKMKGYKKPGRVRIVREGLQLAGVNASVAYQLTSKMEFKLEIGQKLKDVCVSDLSFLLADDRFIFGY